MDGGLVRTQLALPHEVLHQAVVLGEAAELAVLQQVSAGVADVDDDEALLAVHLDQGGGCDRRPHASQVGVVLRLLPHGPVRLADRFRKSFGAVIVVERHPQRLDGGE